jgi:flagellin
MLEINTNIASLVAQNNINKTQNELTQAVTRLSSGLRINSAADDAAGLAISDRMTAQINGLNQAAQNANSGISLAQTADGALSSVSDNLQRIRELAVESANATNSSSDRASLQLEVSQLQAEIDRVATQTQFNGTNLLDGSFTAQQFQVGANAGQTITIAGIASARSSALGQSYGVSASGTTLTAATGITAAGQFTINGTDIYQGTAITGSAAGIAAAINKADITGVTATANATTSGAGTFTAGGAGATTLTINSIAIGLTLTGGATDLANTLAAINSNSAATGVTAAQNGNGLTLSNVTGANITVAVAGTGALANVGLGTNVAATTYSSYNLAYTGTSPLVIAGSVDVAGTTGLANVSTAATATGTSVSAINISTVAGANAALASIDAALASIDSSRASLGAIQNRFTSTVANVQNSAQNDTSSRSGIMDADFAAETANLSRAQVLQQAGTAMVAQANQMPNQVLKLLQ